MPTTKQRINITAEPDIESALKNAAKRDHVSVSSKATELIRFALEIKEDYTLATLAKERDTNKAKFIPHNKFWNKVLKK